MLEQIVRDLKRGNWKVKFKIGSKYKEYAITSIEDTSNGIWIYLGKSLGGKVYIACDDWIIYTDHQYRIETRDSAKFYITRR